MTEPDRMDQTSRELGEQLLQLAQAAPVILRLASADLSQMFYVSPAYEEITGRSCESLYQHPQRWMNAIHPDDRSSVTAFYENHLGHESELEYRIMRPDGSVRWLRELVFPIKNERGGFERVMGFVQDITEHKQIQAAWRESEDRYHRLVEHVPDLVAIHAQGRILTINASGARLLGAKSPEQIIGSLITDRIRSGSGKASAEPARQTEQKWIRLDGTTIDVEATASPITFQNKPAIQVVARDITQRKRTEATLQEGEERHRRLMELYLDSIGVETARTAELQAALRRAQEVDRLKSQLLSIVSHELRTPLTSIRGQTTTLLDYADQISREEQLDALRIVDEEAARLDELIGHLLDMSRLEAGTLRVELVATDLRPILLETLALIAAQAPGHTLAADLPPTLPLVQADPRRVVQVVRNLLDNAIKFSPPGTTATVTAEVLPAAVNIHVRDHGTGIAPEHLPHIFDRFYRLEESNVRTSGAGLGLAICKGLVEAMGGHVTVESQIGYGSTFSFSLPRTQSVHGED